MCLCCTLPINCGQYLLHARTAVSIVGTLTHTVCLLCRTALYCAYVLHCPVLPCPVLHRFTCLTAT